MLTSSEKDSLFLKRYSHILTHSGWSIAIFIIVLLTVGYKFVKPTTDGDIWFHLAYAKYFLQNHTIIPDHTVFSWSPSTNENIYCTWLPELILYAIYKIGGLPGLFIFRYLVALLPVGLCFSYAKKLGVLWNPIVWFACLLSVLTTFTGVVEKPEAFTFVFFVLYCWLWFRIKAEEKKYWKSVYCFPLIMLFWVNSHALFIFGCIFLVLINMGEWLNIYLSPKNRLTSHTLKHLFLASFITVAAVFCNPYTYHYPLHLIQKLLINGQSTAQNYSVVGAYSAPFVADGKDLHGFALCGNIAIIILIILLVRNFRRIEWSILLLNITYLVLYSSFFRTAFFWPPIFLLTTILFISYKHDAIENRILNSFQKYFSYTIRAITFFFTFGFSCLFFYRALVYHGPLNYFGFGDNEATPIEEVTIIERYFPDLRIGNTYTIGSYLIWRRWPEQKVFIDARFFPFENWIMSDYFGKSEENSEPFFIKYSPDAWLVGLMEQTTIQWFLHNSDWRLVFYGKVAAFFVNSKLAIPEKFPLRGESLAFPRNMTTVRNAFDLANAIDDFRGAEIILDGAKKQRLLGFRKYNRRFIDYLGNFLEARVAYKQGRYQKALDVFERSSEDFLEANKPFYIMILMHLSLKSWSSGDRETAYLLNQKAEHILPHYWISYNAAVMNWFEIHEEGSSSTADKRVLEENLRKQLLYFLKNARNTEGERHYIEMASAMLKNEEAEISPSFYYPPK